MGDLAHTYKDGRLGHQGGTSKESAEKSLKWAETMASKVLRAFKLRGYEGFTDCELIGVMRDVSARPRRVGLMHKGIVVDSGERRYTSAKRLAVVWKLAEYVKESENGTDQ